MQNTNDSNAFYQISEILKYVDDDIKNKIPEKLINFIEANKSEDYKWEINFTLPLEKQDLLQTTKEILTIIYREYICSDTEREELDKILNENEIEYQKELKEEYNPDNIFKNNEKTIENETVVSENNLMVEYKESLFKKILSKIKLFFHRKKKDDILTLEV